MMKRSLLLAVGLAALVVPWWSAPGMAALVPNALAPNALVPNALAANALVPNALAANALSNNALNPNGHNLNALTPNALAPNGLPNGNGMELTVLQAVRLVLPDGTELLFR
jgi:hypothetical protein